MKNASPIVIDTTDISLINASNSFLKGVSSETEQSTKLAIWPITVLSPVNITIPLPFPYKLYIFILLLYIKFQRKQDF